MKHQKNEPGFRLRQLLSCAIITVGLMGADSRAQTVPQWNLKPGTTYVVDRVSFQRVAVEIQGKTSTEVRESTWRVRLQPLEERGGDFIVRAEFADVKHRLIGVNMGELLDANMQDKMTGATFTLRVTPSGRITEFRGYEDFLARLTGEKKQAMKSVASAYSETMLRDAFAEIFGPLPEKAVKPGDSWERSFDEPIPHFGLLRATVKNTRQPEKDGIERITYDITTSYELPRNESRVVFRVVEGSIETKADNGVMIFNRKAGHIARHERSRVLRGKLVIQAAHQKLAVDFSGDARTVITIAAGKR